MSTASAPGGGPAPGGALPAPIASVDPSIAIYVALAGFLVLTAQLAIPLWFTLRRRRVAFSSDAVLSPDGACWWDGSAWRLLPAG